MLPVRIDVNLQMVKDGFAWHYKHFDNTQSYADAEIAARMAKRGLWKDSAPIPPYVFRRTKWLIATMRVLPNQLVHPCRAG